MNMEIDGYNIRYQITGSGEKTVVMLQGWGTGLETYDSIARILNRAYTVVQFDFPGFGGSDEPKEAWNVDAFTDFFCKFMEALKIKKATLIGHSYGGRVIIKLANRNSLPFSIEKIVLIDSAGIIPAKSLKTKWKIAAYKVLKKLAENRILYFLFPELIEDWKSRQGSADYQNASPVMKKCLVMAVNEDLKALLPQIKPETLLIWGDQDKATPLIDGRKMERLIPKAGMVVLKNAGHFSFLDKPAEFQAVLENFFQIGAEQ